MVILQTLARWSSRKTVVIPAYTCPLIVFAIIQSRLKLQVCDVSPHSFEFDPEALAGFCDRDTLAIIPTHARTCIRFAVAKQCGAYLIEDTAQALGARYQGKSVGLQGDAGFFSLAAGKGLSIFEGGIWMVQMPSCKRN